MTRLLHVIAEMGVGGAESMVLEMLRRGPSVGWTSAAATGPGSRVPQVARADAEHFPLPLVGRNPATLATAVQRLRRAIASFEPDVLLTHNVVATGATTAARATARGRPPVVAVFHGVSERQYPTAARILHHAADTVVTVSALVRDRLVEAGLPESEVTVIRNSITAPALPDRDHARAALELDGRTPVALCLARLMPQKRHDVLLRAWARLPEEAVLLLAGEGQERPLLEELARHLGLGGDRVRFLGDRSDVPALLAASDVSVLASDWEGLPIAVLESMAAGLPVVATKVDGLAEVVREGEGILVPRRDPDALAAALAQVLLDGLSRKRYSAAARAGVLRRFDPERMMAAYAEICAAQLRS